MVITLIRDKFTPAETLGKMLIDRVPFCGTLEPPIVPNATHPKGCIPVGWYKTGWRTLRVVTHIVAIQRHRTNPC